MEFIFKTLGTHLLEVRLCLIFIRHRVSIRAYGMKQKKKNRRMFPNVGKRSDKIAGETEWRRLLKNKNMYETFGRGRYR